MVTMSTIAVIAWSSIRREKFFIIKKRKKIFLLSLSINHILIGLETNFLFGKMAIDSLSKIHADYPWSLQLYQTVTIKPSRSFNSFFSYFSQLKSCLG